MAVEKGGIGIGEIFYFAEKEIGLLLPFIYRSLLVEGLQLGVAESGNGVFGE